MQEQDQYFINKEEKRLILGIDKNHSVSSEGGAQITDTNSSSRNLSDQIQKNPVLAALFQSEMENSMSQTDSYQISTGENYKRTNSGPDNPALWQGKLGGLSKQDTIDEQIRKCNSHVSGKLNDLGEIGEDGEEDYGYHEEELSIAQDLHNSSPRKDSTPHRKDRYKSKTTF